MLYCRMRQNSRSLLWLWSLNNLLFGILYAASRIISRFSFSFFSWLVLILSLTKKQKKTKFWKFDQILLTVTSFLSRITQDSSRPRVISPVVMSPETWVIMPEIFSYVAQKKTVARRNKRWKIRISDFK